MKQHPDRERFLALATEHEDTLILTASHRQSRYYARLISEQLAQNQQSWLAPQVYSLDLWIGNNESVLDIHATTMLWRIALESVADDNRWIRMLQQGSKSRLITQAATAAYVCHHWGINPSHSAFQEHDDYVFFARWYSVFSDVCRSAGVRSIDAYIANIDHMSPPVMAKRVILAGFVALTPLHHTFTKWLMAQGKEVIVFQPTAPQHNPVCFSCEQSTDEIEWITGKIADWQQRNETQNLALIVPNLHEQWNQVFSIMNHRFNPDTGNADSFASYTGAFNLSGGLPLASMPCIDTALRLLKLNADSPVHEIETLMKLPLVDLGNSDSEANKCTQLCDRGYQATLKQAYADRHWQWLSPWIDAQFWREDYPSELVETINQRLQQAKWLADITLNSNEYQQYQKWEHILAETAKLDRLNQKVPMSYVITAIEDSVSVPYQPQSADARIQVLGLHEAIGLWFDTIWIAGMTEDVLPLQVQPSPCIPLRLQQQAGIWTGSHRTVHTYSDHIWQGLLSTATQVHVSYARNQGEHVSIASPYIASPACEHDQPDHHQQAQVPIDRIISEHLPKPEKKAYSSSLLDDMAACHFRAVVSHRLGVRAKEQCRYYDNRDVGTLIHAVLEATHDGTGQQSRKQIGEALEEKLYSISDKGHWLHNTRAARQIHSQLTEQLYQWIRNDNNHTIIDRELQCQTTIGPLTFSFRIDRIDQVPEGGIIIIDYKTGRIDGTKWHSNQPTHLQLPAYALALRKDRQIDGFGVASLRSDECMYRLIGRGTIYTLFASNDAIGVKWEKTNRNWEEILDYLYQVIKQLVASFAESEVVLNPVPKACNFCDYKAICRIQEKQHA